MTSQENRAEALARGLDPGPSREQMAELVNTVVFFREAFDAIATEMQRATDELQKRPEWIAFAKAQSDQAFLAQELREAEKQLRETAVDIYEEFGEKAPAPGVSVRVYQRWECSREEALQWAVAHGVCLELDDKAFQKAAPKIPGAPGYAVEEPRGMISSRLERIFT